MADGSGFDPGRRRVLFGRRRAERPAVRPPWARVRDFTELCTRCGACEAACPETIIVKGDGGFPTVDFRRGECTFCGGCAEVCPQPIFDRNRRAWTTGPQISRGCLTRSGVICQTCRDICPENVFSFVLMPHAAPRPVIHAGSCTGCGACVSACPADAVTMESTSREPRDGS
ncbi:ferredoxin-type protein NapF [Azospirillum sp. sgz301742]